MDHRADGFRSSRLFAHGLILFGLQLLVILLIVGKMLLTIRAIARSNFLHCFYGISKLGQSTDIMPHGLHLIAELFPHRESDA